MKKLVFTIQILGLMSFFPAYMITELNHENGKLSVTNSSLEFLEKTEKGNIQSALNTKDKKIAFINAKGIIAKETKRSNH